MLDRETSDRVDGIAEFLTEGPIAYHADTARLIAWHLVALTEDYTLSDQIMEWAKAELAIMTRDPHDYREPIDIATQIARGVMELHYTQPAR